MAILRKTTPAASEQIAQLDEAERQRKNLASRAKRRGLHPKVLAQREWIKANPVGFEVR